MSLYEKIAQVLSANGYSVTESGRSLVTKCPTCGKEKHLYIFKEGRNNAKCMKCGASFSPAALVVQLTGCTYRDAHAILGAAGKPTGEQREKLPALRGPQAPKTEPVIPPPEFILPFNFFKLSDRPDLNTPLQYLKKRGISENAIAKYDLRFSPDMQRIVIPVYMNGRCLGWQGRDITGKSELPYLSPAGFSRANVLMGLDCIDLTVEYIILSEGPFDFLKLAFLNNVVCSMGKQVTLQQLKLIQNAKIKKVYLALDPDAHDLFDKIAFTLEPEQEIWLMVPPESKKDFGECDYGEIMEAFKNAIRYGKGSFISAKILK